MGAGAAGGGASGGSAVALVEVDGIEIGVAALNAGGPASADAGARVGAGVLAGGVGNRSGPDCRGEPAHPVHSPAINAQTVATARIVLPMITAELT